MQIILSLLSAIFFYQFLDLAFTKKEKKKETKKKLDYKTLSEMLEEKAVKTSKEERDKIFINTITKKEQSLKYRIKKKIFNAVYSEFNQISLTAYIILTILSMLFGIYVSLIFNNIAVTFILAFGFLFVPYLAISYNNNKKRLDKDKKLQMVMGNLSTAYIRSKTFLEAVENNIDIIPDPLKKDFVFFVRDLKYMQSDKTNAMVELRDKINNAYFHRFMNLVINAELGEDNLKYTILGIPQDYKRYIDINNNFLREVRDKNKIFIITLACFPISLGIIRAMSSYYFEILTNTMLGKVTVTLILIILAIISILFIRINKPVEIKM